MSANPIKLAPVALATAMAVVAMVSTAARAQSAPAVASTEAPYNINLAAQPLGDALNELARQTGLQLLVRRELVEGKMAALVNGRLTRSEALQRILSGTGLTASIQGSSVVVTAEPSASQATLPTVTVVAAPETEAASGPVTGYAAKRSATATKTDTPLMEVPQSIQVIGADVIEEQQASTLTEVYRNVSGVAVDYYSNNVGAIETPLVRGFGLLSIYVNGLPTSGFPFTLGNVERVEVLRGAASVLYGVSQPGGTVNVVTKRPTMERQGAVSIGAGSRGAYELEADIGGAINDAQTAAFRLNVSAEDLGSFRDFVKDRRYTLAPSLLVNLGPRTELIVEALAYRRDYTFDTGLAFSPQGRPIAPISTFLGSRNANDSQTDVGSLGYSLRHQLSDSWEVRHVLRRIKTKTTLNAFRPGGSTQAGLVVDDLYDETVPINTNTQALVESQSKFLWGGVGHTLLAGLDWRKERYTQNGRRADETSLAPVDVINPDNDRLPLTNFDSAYDYKAEWRGLYLQDQMSLMSDRLKLLAGIRHDQFKEVDAFSVPDRQSVTSGRVGVLYRLTDNLSPFASWSSSWFPNSYSPSVTGKAIDPERGSQIEAGLKYGGEDSPLTASLAVYQLTKDNVAVADVSNPGFSVNGGKLRSQGIELDVAGRLSKQTRVVAAYGYTDTEVLVSDSLPLAGAFKNVPRHTLRLWAAHDLANGWTIKGGVYRASKRFGNDANTFTLDGYTLLDLGADYRFQGPAQAPMTLSIAIKNLVDKEHYLNANATGSVSPGAPRSVSVRLRTDF